ncbi:pentapeptide repeat-containing protein, partial [Helicobacter sp. MIT 01-3238]|uniref:pentapeptide repeat-containing protein n=1 Tax=Helicobacter sp. MIT 01-3238 TaxID=398627 RepID=UPI000E1F7682
PKQQIYENLHFDFAKDKLILTIKQGKSFVFENALDNAYKQWLEEGKLKDELEKLIKKQGNKYIIYKPLEICTENTNDTESRKSTQESGECNKESKRKIIYLQDGLSFKNCVFNAEVYFNYIVFASQDSKESTQPLRLDFQHCKFHKRVYFTNCEFNGNVFFNHAVFEKYADFHESIFNGVVSFYNAEFKSAPNFSTCVFQNLQATNFINVKIDDIDFGKILYFIAERINDDTYKKEVKSLKEKYSQKLQESKENQYKIDKKYKEDKKEITKEHRIRYASNARDSFRTIKNVLIANNNLLDACAWHKLELYAKEHEIDLKAPNRFSKEWIEGIQLCFYRHTSAHHTDLLKILSWFVVLVGGFAVALFATNNLCNVGEIFSLIVFIVLTIATYKKDFFGIWTFINVIFFLALLACNPKYIFGVANLFGNDKCQSDWFLNLILSLYSIAFILVIFSLQKTARKNSIIPN